MTRVEIGRSWLRRYGNGPRSVFSEPFRLINDFGFKSVVTF